MDLAREKLKENSAYALVLTDCQMPVMDGYNFSIKLRQLYLEQEVDQPLIIAVTGNVESERIDDAWNAKIDEVISKPVTVEIIKMILTEVLHF